MSWLSKLGDSGKKIVQKVENSLGKNSVVSDIIRHPANTLIGTAIVPGFGTMVGAGITENAASGQRADAEHQRQQQAAQDQQNATVSSLEQLAKTEEEKRNALGLKQQQQILDFAEQQTQSAADYRRQLAQSLSSQGQETFSLANPGILEDLNSRGLFTSQTARDEAQARALKEIALANEGTLTNYDINTQGQINDLKTAGLSAMLGGEQSAVDTALGLRQSAISQQFQAAQQASQNSLAQWLAQQQSRNQLISAILGAGGSALGGYLGRP